MIYSIKNMISNTKKNYKKKDKNMNLLKIHVLILRKQSKSSNKLIKKRQKKIKKNLKKVRKKKKKKLAMLKREQI